MTINRIENSFYLFAANIDEKNRKMLTKYINFLKPAFLAGAI